MQFKQLVHPVPFRFPGRHEDLAAYDKFTANQRELEFGKIVWSFKKIYIAYSIIFHKMKGSQKKEKKGLLNFYKYIF